MKRKAVIASVLMGATAPGSTGVASADTALALQAGTLGVGAALAIGLTEKLNLRLGYSFFDYSTTLEDTDVTYDAELQLLAGASPLVERSWRAWPAEHQQ